MNTLFFFFCIDLTPSYHIPPAGGMACFEQVFFFFVKLSRMDNWVMSINKSWVPGCIYTYLERHLITTPLSQAWVFYNDVCVCILYSLVVVVGIY